MLTSLRIAPVAPVDETPTPDGMRETIVLDGAACWHLLDREGMGRLAISAADGAAIFPLNYLCSHGRLYFRSAPGTKIVELTEHPRVAFEVDGQVASGRAMGDRWSVVVRGMVRRLGSDPEILRSGVDTLRSWHPGEKFNYFEIQPEQISGRLVPTDD